MCSKFGNLGTDWGRRFPTLLPQETTYKHFHDIRLRPEQFNEYLLSPEVGFASCELIDTPSHASKGEDIWPDL